MNKIIIVKEWDPDKCECWVCHKTFPYFNTVSPMVSEKVWKEVAYDEPKVKYFNKTIRDNRRDIWIGGGFLCKDCMEQRLGRPLVYEDLKDYELKRDIPFNIEFIKKYFPDHIKS